MGKPKSLGARKATQYRAKQIAPEAAFDRSKSRFNSNSIQSYDDTYGSGDEDQFHLNRDKLLLDEVSGSRGGKGADGDEVEQVDTIYDLDLPSSASDNDDDDDDDEEAEKPVRVPRHLREYKRRDTGDNKTLGRFGHEYDPKQDVVFPSSSEEDSDDDAKGAVDASQLAGPDGDSDSDEPSRSKKKRGSDNDDDDANSDSDLDEEHERWSAGHYHASRRAPGEADSEDDEALELEEQEARRLQRKMKDRLDGADFGVAGDGEGEGEDEMDLEKAKQERLRLEEEDENAEGKTSSTATSTADLSEEEAIALLLRTQPETLALVDDFLLTSSKLAQVTRDLAEVRSAKDEQGNDHPSLAIMELEHQALTTYLPTLAFYFSLLLGNKSPEQGLVDKVLARLSSLRGALATMEELDLTSATYGAAQSDDDEDEDDEDASEEEGVNLKSSKSRRLVPPEEMFNLADSDASTEASDDSDVDEITDSMLIGIDDDELEELMQELGPGDGAEVLMEKVRERQREKGIEVEEEEGESDEDEEDDVTEEDEEEETRATAPLQTKTRRTPAAAAIPALPALAPMSTKASSSSTTRSTSAASDLLDPLSLSRTDLADKASKRHTLRFHAAQVEQKASKRDARRRGLEGDDDVPRRSKEQARREVLKRQQHGAAKDAQERARLDGDEFGEEDERDARVVRGERAGAAADEADEDGYYDLVAAEKAEGRQAKKARYDEARAAEREEILSLAESAVDGPRAATRKILSNRGLTPKRNKLNRNARVKKRHQYDQKQKKLRSMQATYSGGEARTGYEGERTGISRQNVRSRKLG